jgi:sugar lactone lactonase YvrE
MKKTLLARRNIFLRITTMVVFFTLASLLIGCGGSSRIGTGTTPASSPSFALADSGNNRVIFYNTPLSTDQSASVVLGQIDFIHGSANQGAGPGANTLNGPQGMAKDSAGNLYVTDSVNCRVLQFRPPFTNGMNASVVIGQPGFNSVNCLPAGVATASGMGIPTSVAVGSNGNLWVTESWNSRVLEFVPPFTNGMAATLVIGQTGMSGAGCNEGVGPGAPSASGICQPSGVSFDPKGNLWVSDYSNSRVLEFVPPFSTGMAATLELGQPSATGFTSNLPDNGGVSANSLFTPEEPAFDSNGNLWLADPLNNRVLEYVPPFTNGMAANTVIGQADFTHSGVNQGDIPGVGGIAAANTLFGPIGLVFDGSGNLWLADSRNNRVLKYAPPLTNGAAATAVIGQPNFKVGAPNQGLSGTPGPAANTLFGPSSGVMFN